MTFMPNFNSAEELAAHQLKGLRWTVAHAQAGSPFYARRLQEAGVTPGDIKSLDDLRGLPFTMTDDLRAGYPFPLLSVPIEEVVRVHASSGTTGKRKVLAYTQKDLDDWAHMFARCYEMAGLTRADRVQIMVGYGVWTAGVGFQAGCERFGALALPVGPGNLEMQWQFLVDFQSTVMCSTSSMALLMAEEIKRRGLGDQVKINKLIYGSERTSEAMRQRISQALGAELFDIPGLTELYGPGTGIECRAHQGIHYWADYYILEILDPVSLEPVAPGEIGEMVVTTLCKEAAPLIRYRTRDLCRLLPEPCPCGNILPRHGRIMGRSDDMIKFRAVNIYPGQIDHVLSQSPGVGSEYQVHLRRGEDGRDYMVIMVERAPEGSAGDDQAVAASISKGVKAHILVSAEIQVMDYGSLPRSERKSQRIFDRREEV
ncbi:MAG: phenylacetate--CoA ligase [Proteobacteria bacterium]|nr:phenylacetate--CoA ligase [Pseudomonadota bacterium]MBU1449754.1 phenylacetate--CoA ligase [Pseudomonadota bacterium]MBU2468991.1 phenylacetate--CoA ligase [Pseudomonadota bacterium]MBU2517253.1 phenylacetate--CoA ligase [Pseudomonadota bacterium]